MDQNRLLQLTEKLAQGTASDEEIYELDAFYFEFEKKKGYTHNLDPIKKGVYKEIVFNKIQIEVDKNEAEDKARIRNLSPWYIGAAASLVFCIGMVLYYYSGKREKVYEESRITAADIKPGGNKAILTLADGHKINLTEADIGTIADENGMTIRKTADGQLAYNKSDGNFSHVVSSNLIETPRGGKFQIQLPDGTKVWLNAASSLRYPSAFIENERVVELIGEGYFEVAENRKMPFKVKTNSQIVEVIGTHFNISSYPEEDLTKTTLIEGSVKIHHNGNLSILEPGQQAVTAKEKTEIQVSFVDASDVLTWKNGYFVFENASIQYIMNYLSRWYDVEIEYTGSVTKKKFGGAFQQSADIKELLKYLETYGDVHFKITGRRVIVMN